MDAQNELQAKEEAQNDLTREDAMAASSTQAPPKEPVKCARPGCPQRFVPYRAHHIYCSPRCKKTVLAYKFALSGGK